MGKITDHHFLKKTKKVVYGYFVAHIQLSKLNYLDLLVNLVKVYIRSVE